MSCFLNLKKFLSPVGYCLISCIVKQYISVSTDKLLISTLTCRAIAPLATQGRVPTRGPLPVSLPTKTF